MGSLSMAALVAGGAFLASVTFDVGVNALQNWYDVVYADAFWSSRVTDSPSLRALAKEEADIDQLLVSPEFPEKRVVIRKAVDTVAAKP